MPSTITKTFHYTGAAQSYVLPPNYINGTLKCELAGGVGADNSGGNNAGLGSYIVCFPFSSIVPAGSTLHIYVGGAANGRFGGWNGGGDGGTSTNGYDGFGGGGASDIRVGGTALSNRIAVAAGGAGSVNDPNAYDAFGGNGEYPSGWDGSFGGFHPHPAGPGKGGTQTSGGAAGNSYGLASDNATAGTLGQGGHGSNHSTAGYNSGGGGGGGYYGGGGGGGSDPNGVPAAGGGGSSYVHPSSNHNGADDNVNAGAGYVILTFQVRDPVTSAEDLLAVGSMTFGGQRTSFSVEALTVRASLVQASSSRIATGSLSMQTDAALSAFRGATSLFSTTSMQAQAQLRPSGFRTTDTPISMVGQATLFVQQTLSSAQFAVVADMDVTADQTELAPVVFVAQGRLLAIGFRTQVVPSSLSAQGSLTFTPIVLHDQALQMAARASVVDAGLLTAFHVTPMSSQASVSLTGALQHIAFAPFMIAAGSLVTTVPILHPEKLALQAQGSLVIVSTTRPIAAPFFRGLAEISMLRTQISNVILLVSHGSMIVEETPISVLDRPYLHVVGPPADMDFFTTSYPNRGDVRQVVKNVFAQ